MATTYEPIATTTLSSAANSISFSSISSTYTDLRVVVVTTPASGSLATALQFNADTAGSSNYSMTRVYGNGTSAVSSKQTSTGWISTSTANTGLVMVTFDIFSYAGSTNKTVLYSLSADANGSGSTSRGVGLWRSTAAISTVVIVSDSATNFAIGTTATLYGIAAA